MIIQRTTLPTASHGISCHHQLQIPQWQQHTFRAWTLSQIPLCRVMCHCQRQLLQLLQVSLSIPQKLELILCQWLLMMINIATPISSIPSLPAATTQSQPTATPSSSRPGSSVGVILGAVLGTSGLVAMVIVFGWLKYCWRAKRSRMHKGTHTSIVPETPNKETQSEQHSNRQEIGGGQILELETLERPQELAIPFSELP